MTKSEEVRDAAVSMFVTQEPQLSAFVLADNLNAQRLASVWSLSPPGWSWTKDGRQPQKCDSIWEWLWDGASWDNDALIAGSGINPYSVAGVFEQLRSNRLILPGSPWVQPWVLEILKQDLVSRWPFLATQ